MTDLGPGVRHLAWAVLSPDVKGTRLKCLEQPAECGYASEGQYAVETPHYIAL